jgi:hypothetical protein
MEKHFLADVMEGPPRFEPRPWYNPEGDCLVYHAANEAVVADRIDEMLTIYRSAVDERPIGYQIKGVAALISKFGWDGLAVRSQTFGQELQKVSVAALLLAAYEDGPKTLGRRGAYASLMRGDAPRHEVPRAELQPA